jgi:hypothetical protein
VAVSIPVIPAFKGLTRSDPERPGIVWGSSSARGRVAPWSIPAFKGVTRSIPGDPKGLRRPVPRSRPVVVVKEPDGGSRPRGAGRLREALASMMSAYTNHNGNTVTAGTVACDPIGLPKRKAPGRDRRLAPFAPKAAQPSKRADRAASPPLIRGEDRPARSLMRELQKRIRERVGAVLAQ